MARMVQRASVGLVAHVELDEDEIDALGYLADYADDAVVRAIGKHVSPQWERDHGAAFAKMMRTVGGHFSRLKKQRADMEDLLAGRGRFFDAQELQRHTETAEYNAKQRAEAEAERDVALAKVAVLEARLEMPQNTQMEG